MRAARNRTPWTCAVLLVPLLAATGCAGNERALQQPSSGGREGRVIREVRSGTWSPGLTEAERNTLFQIATDTVRWCVGGTGGEFSFDAYTLTPTLETPFATFVTLKTGGRLRGCIGSLAPTDTLYRSVHENAVNAAMRDPRFPPVGPAELAGLDVEISVLSPIEPIPSLEAFRLGEHGIILQKGMHRAVYLPEVAPEQGWTVDETLSSLSRKAGLPPDAWRKGAQFQIFSSVKLGP
jgi:AmmeMemoRadiSam system protein A